jgi:hypothetical protein
MFAIIVLSVVLVCVGVGILVGVFGLLVKLFSLL